MASEEGLIIEDVDLVFVIAFDLGDKVDAKELGEAFARHYNKLVEGVWHPPKEPDHTSIAIYIAARKLGRIDSNMTLKEFIDNGLDRELRDDVHVRE